MVKTISIVATLALLTTSAAMASPDPSDACRGVAIRQTPAVFDGEVGRGVRGEIDYLRRGQTEGALSELVVHRSGAHELCQHGGACYRADDIRLTNCHVEKAALFSDSDETAYGTALNRR